jgi:hypothetical protein
VVGGAIGARFEIGPNGNFYMLTGAGVQVYAPTNMTRAGESTRWCACVATLQGHVDPGTCGVDAFLEIANEGSLFI